MRPRYAIHLPAALLVIACGRSADQSAMPGMSAEEHSQMHGAGVATDSTGVAARQAVQLSAAEERALGVTYTSVQREDLVRTVRTVGRIDVPEPNIRAVALRIDGFIEQVFVGSTGDRVRAGQPLLTVYSPMLVTAQEELLAAKRLVERVDSSSGDAWLSAQAMLAATRRRLAAWDVTAEQVRQIEESGVATMAVALASPVGGTVLEKSVLSGQQAMAGEQLYRIADLSELWIEGDVFEQDLQFVRVGAQAHIEVSAYPGEHLMGRVSFVYPTVDQQSRTNRVRVSVRNADLRLKPGMFATIYFDAPIGRQVLTVPLAAVVVTGERNLVFVRHADGTLMPHSVVLGARAQDRVQILAGLVEGDTVVASANFLVDAESQLRSTGAAMPGMQHGTAVEPNTPPPEHRHD